MNPQEETRLWQRIIALETGLEELKKKDTKELELRLKTLEEARQRQITFNTEVSNRLAKLEKPVKPEVKETKFKWPWN